MRELEDFGIQLVSLGQTNAQLSAFTVQSPLVEEIQLSQESDPELQRVKQNLENGKSPGFVIHKAGTLQFQNRLCVPKNEGLRKQIFEEAHNTRYLVHPGGTKMYRDLRQYFWWNNMKKDVAKYVNKCLICQKVKAEHQRPVGELRPLEIPTWKWDSISMDFIMGLHLSASKKNAI